MGYQVISKFTDATDNKRLYEVGQTFPRDGIEVSDERINYLLNKNGDFKRPFIKFVDEPEESESTGNEEFPKHTGGGFYELSNGEKVKGKEAAVEAENALKGE